jgi:hypothetical protein
MVLPQSGTEMCSVPRREGFAIFCFPLRAESPRRLPRRGHLFCGLVLLAAHHFDVIARFAQKASLDHPVDFFPEIPRTEGISRFPLLASAQPRSSSGRCRTS